ncbi:MAG TPA: hypothetical protein VI815_02340 [Candidatus Nanoarchaeia archaeon]|nr:hypothetical protein [Candidatus Nanoarchaeia archaeon]
MGQIKLTLQEFQKKIKIISQLQNKIDEIDALLLKDSDSIEVTNLSLRKSLLPHEPRYIITISEDLLPDLELESAIISKLKNLRKNYIKFIEDELPFKNGDEL